MPAIAVDKGADDGVFTSSETSRPGFGNVYVAYFGGTNHLPARRQAADIFVSRSTDNGATFGPNRIQADVATGRAVRPDARPNSGDYISACFASSSIRARRGRAVGLHHVPAAREGQ